MPYEKFCPASATNAGGQDFAATKLATRRNDFAAMHNGNGISFLPKSVRFLDSFSDPTKMEAPFVFFNGYWGDVPKGIIFHRSCFYPEGRAQNHFKISEAGFVDRDPFAGGTLSWPPSRLVDPGSRH